MNKASAVLTFLIILAFNLPASHASGKLDFTNGDPQDTLNNQYKVFVVVKNVSPQSISDYQGHMLDNKKPLPRKLNSFLNKNIDWASYSRAIFSFKWDDLDKSQRKEFMSLARTLAIKKYGKHFSPDVDFSARFNQETTYQTRKQADQAKVPVMIVSKKDVKYDVDFIFCRGKQRWAVCDVYIDGVSHTKTYATQVKTIYNKKGFDGVLAAFQRAIDKE